MIDIIAEIGINFMGDMNIARKLIADAAECGATVAKFQWYSVYDLFGNPSKETYNKDIYENVQAFELDEAKLIQLSKWCELEGIEFMCSIFDEERFLKLENTIGVRRHKLASRVSKYDRDLAHKVLDTGKPTYVSLGFDAEGFDTNKYPNCMHLYCVAKYPTEHYEFDIPKSFDLSGYYGFSSHAMDPYPAMVALARGAQCIEVHFTLDKSMAALKGGYDHICSLDKTELKQLCDFAHSIRRIK